MLLAIDTATRWAGIALHDGSHVVAERGWQCLNSQTIELTPAIDEMLKLARVTPVDLQGVAVAIGPGSYTGLRVGLAMAKGLALANGIPLVGVPTLDIVSASFGPRPEQLLVAVAAGRDRVAAAGYQWRGGEWLAEKGPVTDTWESLLSRMSGEATIFAGEITPAAGKLIRSANKAYRLASPASSVRRAGYLAELGWRRLRKGLADDSRDLAPIYMRDPAGN
jgi:tRNA threonylcarbamoyladenosine biosynthesis protein TsaB